MKKTLPKTNDNEQKYIIITADFDAELYVSTLTKPKLIERINQEVVDRCIEPNEIEPYITVIEVGTGKIMKIEVETTINLK